MNIPCNKTEVIDMIKDDVTEIKSDVKSLLEFKNKLLGIIAGITATTTLFFNLILFIFKK